MIIEKKIYLSIIIFGLISVLLIVFLIHPLFLEIRKISQEIVSQRQDIASFAAEIKNLKDFKEIYPVISSDLEKIDNLFIDPEFPIDFIIFLEEIAQQSQLTIEILPFPVGEIKERPWPFLTFQIRTTAPFPKFLGFFNKIENSPYLIEIENLTVAKAREELKKFAPGKMVEAVITLKIFSKPR